MPEQKSKITPDNSDFPSPRNIQLPSSPSPTYLNAPNPYDLSPPPGPFSCITRKDVMQWRQTHIKAEKTDEAAGTSATETTNPDPTTPHTPTPNTESSNTTTPNATTPDAPTADETASESTSPPSTPIRVTIREVIQRPTGTVMHEFQLDLTLDTTGKELIEMLEDDERVVDNPEFVVAGVDEGQERRIWKIHKALRHYGVTDGDVLDIA